MDLQDITRNTLKKYISIFNLSGKTVEEILAKNESELLRLFNEKPAPYPMVLPRESMPGIHFAA